MMGMILRSAHRPILLALMLAAIAVPAGAKDKGVDLHAVMVGKLDGSCRLDSKRLARFEPRMIVIHAVIDQTSLPTGWARARVLRPVLGGVRAGALLPVAHGYGARFVAGKEYLISMYRFNNVYVVDYALQCQAEA